MKRQVYEDIIQRAQMFMVHGLLPDRNSGHCVVQYLAVV